MKKILVLGATSKLAQETAKHFAADGAAFFLVGRDNEKLKSVSDDLTARGASEARFTCCDLAETSNHALIIEQARRALEDIDLAFLCYGTLSDQQRSQEDFAYALKELQTNYISYVSLLTLLANIFEHRGSGTIAVITSVAGDRGRKKNYLYGSAKGGLSVFLQGLGHRLAPYGVRVIDIKPGMVKTPMTANLPQGPLLADPASVGRLIYGAILKPKSVVYVPGIWRAVMSVIRNLPNSIFNRLDI